MKLRSNNRDGYIMVLTLLIISLAILMTTIMFDRGSSYVPYARAVIDREKAIILAQGGLAIAESQLLAISAEQPEKQKTQPAQPMPQSPQNTSQEATSRANQDITQLLQKIIPTLNEWQIFKLTEEHDGIDGTLQLCIMSEEGKINLADIYDFKAKKFKEEAKAGNTFKEALVSFFADIEKAIGTKDLFSQLEQFLQKRGYPLNDVTELLTIKAFSPFKNSIYYEPPSTAKKGSPKKICALTDLFTLTSSATTADPWLLSESLRTIFNIPPLTATHDQKKADVLTETLKKFKKKAEWQKDWDQLLKPLYGAEFARLPKYSTILLRNDCMPRYFSVLIQSLVGDATQRLYVILERIKKSQDTRTEYKIVIRSYYWL